jgi:hypothetical protein
MQEVASAQALNASNLMFWLVVVAGMVSSIIYFFTVAHLEHHLTTIVF